MNKIKYILTAMLFSVCAVSYSQNLDFGIQTGIGFYNMNGLKSLNATVFKSLPFQAGVISDYPPFFYYKPVFFLSFNKFRVGLQASFYSTGSRISSKDYSGEYLFDTKTYCIAPSANIDFLLFTFCNKYKLFLFSEGGITYSSLELNASYFFQFGKKVFESDKGEILNDGKRAIGPDWSGLRFGITLLLTSE